MKNSRSIVPTSLAVVVVLAGLFLVFHAPVMSADDGASATSAPAEAPAEASSCQGVPLGTGIGIVPSGCSKCLDSNGVGSTCCCNASGPNASCSCTGTGQNRTCTCSDDTSTTTCSYTADGTDCSCSSVGATSASAGTAVKAAEAEG